MICPTPRRLPSFAIFCINSRIKMASNGETSDAKMIQNAVVSTVLMGIASLADSSAATEFFFFNRRRRSHRNTILAAALSCGKDFPVEVVPRLSDPSFKRHFRISRSTFEHVLELTSASATMVPAQTAALLGLWVLGNSETFTEVSDRFRLSTRSQASEVFLHFCSTLSDRSGDFVQWPRGLLAVRTRRDFAGLQLAEEGEHMRGRDDRGEKELELTNIPDVVGCVGTVCLRLDFTGLDARSVNSSGRRNRSRAVTTNVAMQIVCDARLLITDVCAGSPARVDATWDVADFCESSPLWSDLLTKPEAIPANCHILGDVTFPLLSTLLTPYAVALNGGRRLFNRALRATRAVTVDRALARLFGRFRACLRDGGLSAVPSQAAPRVLMACCVLHNLCVASGDRTPEVDSSVPVATGTCRRQTSSDDRGVVKRDDVVRRMVEHKRVDL